MNIIKTEPKIFFEYREGINNKPLTRDKQPNPKYGKPYRSFYSSVEGVVYNEDNRAGTMKGFKVDSETMVDAYFNETAIRERDLKAVIKEQDAHAEYLQKWYDPIVKDMYDKFYSEKPFGNV